MLYDGEDTYYDEELEGVPRAIINGILQLPPSYKRQPAPQYITQTHVEIKFNLPIEPRVTVKHKSEPDPRAIVRSPEIVTDLEQYSTMFIEKIYGGYRCCECGCEFDRTENIYIYQNELVFHKDCLDPDKFESLDPDNLMIIYPGEKKIK